jgi:hypothetical protein
VTKDLDLFVAPSAGNAKRFLLALGEFFGGAAPTCVTIEALLDPTLVIQLGVAPVRVDVLSHFATDGENGASLGVHFFYSHLKCVGVSRGAAW